MLDGSGKSQELFLERSALKTVDDLVNTLADLLGTCRQAMARAAPSRAENPFCMVGAENPFRTSPIPPGLTRVQDHDPSTLRF